MRLSFGRIPAAILGLLLMIFPACSLNAAPQEREHSRPALKAGSELTQPTQNERFRVSLRPHQGTIELDQLHSWIIHVADENGNPVDGAELSLEGGMPDHDHGLPTEPQITENLGDGDYLLDGVRFNMPGWWQFTITVSANGIADHAVFDFTLQ